jgi:hypothetical protein
LEFCARFTDADDAAVMVDMRRLPQEPSSCIDRVASVLVVNGRRLVIG